MMQDEYNITVRPITTRNPQANAILDRVYQTIGNILRNMVLNDVNIWDGILAATIFALGAPVHTTTQHTPAQLVFGRDSLMSVSYEDNWCPMLEIGRRKFRF